VNDALTILLVCPPDGTDPLGLLADSVGGGRVPTRYRHRWTATKPPRGTPKLWMKPPYGEWGPWVHFVVSPTNTETERALVLSLNGTVDEIGMGRARERLVSAWGGSAEHGSAWHRSHRGYFELWALWPHPISGLSWRSRNFMPYRDVHEADHRLCTEINIAAPYLADDLAACTPAVIADHAKALGLAFAHRAPTYRLALVNAEGREVS
jgi:hypothetical protein